MKRALTLAAMLALAPVGAHAAQPPLLQKWYKLNDQCRGGSGDKPETLRACDKREALGRKLEKAGWEYGYMDWYGFCLAWHPKDEPEPNRPECVIQKDADAAPKRFELPPQHFVK